VTKLSRCQDSNSVSIASKTKAAARDDICLQYQSLSFFRFALTGGTPLNMVRAAFGAGFPRFFPFR
jgi:hypothetical protein